MSAYVLSELEQHLRYNHAVLLTMSTYVISDLPRQTYVIIKPILRHDIV